MSVAKDLRMPQFELEMVTAKNCDNKIHMGESSKFKSICPGSSGLSPEAGIWGHYTL